MASGHLLQVSRSNGGLPKRAMDGPVLLGVTGVQGDRQRNLKYHGGPDKAVLMIAAEVVDELAEAGYPLLYGTLGENLTVSGLDRRNWRSGQRYRVGEDAIIELTTLRSPCHNLLPYSAGERCPLGPELYDARCRGGDFSSPRWAKGGFYARVIRGGLLVAGAPVSLESDTA